MDVITDVGVRRRAMVSLLFSFRGRINRETYWPWLVSASAVEIVLLYASFLISFAVADNLRVYRPAQLWIWLLANFVVIGLMLVVDWISFALLAKRFHDRGRSGWWSLLGFVPILGSLGVMAYTALLPGNPAANRHGLSNPGRGGIATTTAAFIGGLILLGGLTFAGRTYLAEPFYIPSGSNAPTVLPGDLAMISKRLSLTQTPEYGDLVVFKNQHTGEDFIKRVVGLPGDRVQFRHGILVLNDIPWPRERVANYDSRYWDEGFGRAVTERRYCYVETMPNRVKHEILGGSVNAPEDSLPQDNTDVFVVPDGRFFVVGDNRDNSMDSRMQLGTVPLTGLIGKAEFLYFSSEDRGGFWQTLKVSPWVRWSRLFKNIN
jgi:signal peptidase I